MIHYLSLEDISLINKRLIKESGGTFGIRDGGLIESACARPKAGFGDHEAYPNIYLKTAVLGHSLLKNHPFIDGNKRTAMVAMIVFLKQNQITLVLKRGQLVKMALKIAEDKVTEQQIANWLAANSQKNIKK